ncbi:MAG: hypothetical protein AAF850_03270 [Pseudomonadota bacterium]
MAATDKISPEKMARLTTFLGSLPVGVSAKLFAVLEAGAAGGADDLPYGDMLATLRTNLQEAREAFPARRLSAQRLFFDPIEDFLIVARTGKKRRARIDRATLSPLWALLSSEPSCAPAARAAEALTKVLARDDASPDEAATAQEAMYAAASGGLARVIDRAEREEVFRDSVVRRFGGPPAYHDVVEIGIAVDAARQLLAVQTVIEKEQSALSDTDCADIVEIYKSANDEAPHASAYVLLCATARLASPWRALDLAFALSDAGDEACAEGANVVVESIFEELEDLVRGLEAEAAADFHAAQAELRIAHFADYANGVEEVAAARGDNVVLSRLEACRDVAAGAMERFAEQSVAALRTAMPTRRSGGSSRLAALRPDISKTVSPTLAREGFEAADFLARANDVCMKIRRENALTEITGEAATQARRYAEDLVREIRAAEGEERAAARRMMDQTLKILAPLVAEDEIGLIRDRASAAALSA